MYFVATEEQFMRTAWLDLGEELAERDLDNPIRASRGTET